MPEDHAIFAAPPPPSSRRRGSCCSPFSNVRDREWDRACATRALWMYIIPTSDVWKGSNHLKCYSPLLPLRERGQSQSLRVPNCHIVLFFIWHTSWVLCIEKKLISKNLVHYNIPNCPNQFTNCMYIVPCTLYRNR